MKVAIVHDWLVNYGGAELFVEYLLKMYPDADIYTLVYDKKKMGNHFLNNKIYTSKIQKIPFSSKIYTKLLKFMPMRYAWDLFFDYRKRSGKLTRFFMNKWMPQIRQWDYISSQRIDTIIANSKYIARRIKKFWNRDAHVVYLPVDVSRFSPTDAPVEDYYVAFSRLVPYKRIDLAVSACKKLGKKLVVIGGGSEFDNLKKLADNDKNIVFTGRASDEDVLYHLQRCKALLFCAEEDFGFVPLEVQACGRPVIAFGKGGALETVIDNKTGIFFEEQTPDSLAQAILRFEELDKNGTFPKETILKHANSFTEERFQTEFKSLVDKTIEYTKYR